MHEAEICRAKGFLSADDTRKSYYLSDYVNDFVYKEDQIVYDKNTELFFKATNIRLDWFGRKFFDIYSYKKPEKFSLYKELIYREKKKEFQKCEYLIIFTHEWQIYNQGHLTFKTSWLKNVCRFAKEYGYEFGYPMDDINQKGAVIVE